MAAALVPDALWSLIRPLLSALMPKPQGDRPRVPPVASKRKPFFRVPIYSFTSPARSGCKSMFLMPASVLGYGSILWPFMLRC